MSSPEMLKEADRVMVICNSCRYCEGFCAVFPAMERRRTFTAHDLKYLANLCHNCRDCYYACQYAPPHEFDVNVPKTLAELRLETYREFTWPGVFKGLFRQNGLAVALVTTLSVLLVLLLTFLSKGPAAVFAIHSGENAFYQIISYWAIVIPLSALGLFVLTTLLKGIANFWRETGGTPGELFSPQANAQAIWDVLQLKYLDGGGHGCNYPDDRFSFIRKWFHHFVFYGFILCFISTTIAAIYDHFLHWPAPYPFWSWPVVLGTMGGVALLIGTVGLLVLKLKMDPSPAAPRAFSMDIAFLSLLFLTSLTGLLLLVFRETGAMGILLAVHLGIVVGLFITMPYGKFIHAAYRYAALARNANEKLAEDRLAVDPTQNKA
ncbi:MAG: tricarballylate utilization 4Fe-4S protein TcuB [Desulfobacterales bacterium]|nr:tricarballylate utilization 4Fe-4S protein TcuB [Desulfobacterales bacterium]